METKRNNGDVVLEMSAPSSTSSMTTTVDDDFNCPICYDLLLDPVTVSCGHTCCQHCLLRYLKSAANVRCPAGCASTLPRQLPAINVLLKSRLERQYGTQLAVRRKDVEHDRQLGLIPPLPTPTTTTTSIAGHGNNGGHGLGGGAAAAAAVAGNGVAGGIAAGPVAVDFVADPVAVFDNNPAWDAMVENSRKLARQTYMRMGIAVMMAMLAHLWVPLPVLTTSLGDVANVKLWTPVEVAAWVGSQSDPDVAALKDIFIEHDIDGPLLLTLDSNNLKELSPAMNDMAGKRLMILIHKLQLIPRRPTDFWEYFEQSPHGTIVIIAGIIVAPRTSLLYLYFFDATILLSVMGSQLVFWFGWMVSPHVLTAMYVLSYVHVHPRLVTCLCFTLLWHAQTDALALQTLREKPREYLRTWASGLAWVVGIAALFPAFPRFIQTLLLWWCLFGPLNQVMFACCVGVCPRIWPPIVAWAQRQDERRRQRRAAGARV